MTTETESKSGDEYGYLSCPDCGSKRIGHGEYNPEKADWDYWFCEDCDDMVADPVWVEKASENDEQLS